ncbi:LacI family DNA-binding transcriptional regulator [Alicyclobacillus fastidiosus]|uniref:LacI family DNA-binding transcriptional regulator n=1 Tax=Alicyclobacillus fastidiosus TaxID=392011 RepID=A0ABV5A9Z4_9BACL|nr:LacI family DNA-binding transcriptional regulator [Alicyclobacillus fastidiosus]WEH07752.1 LacI family DNA-binding transcriptional regulator [Alicyclobacillus fastidiosus]
MANIDDVARLSGVSKGTVSNVFTQNRRVRKEVAERVLKAAQELNFKPNYWARTLSVKKTNIVGLSMPGENTKFSKFHMSLINGVLQVCYEHGYRLLINTMSTAYQGQAKYMTTNPVDGEIFLDPEQDDTRLTQRTQSDPPAVVVGKPPERLRAQLCYVDNDNEMTAEQVTQYLIRLGHRDILFLNTSEERTVSIDRQRGYEAALGQAGISVRPELHVFKDASVLSLDYGWESMHRLIAQGVSFSAVVADTDKVALGVYRAAGELGLSIPGDISVFAFSDDSVFAPEFRPPLSGVSLNAEDLGREAAALLIRRIEDDSAPIVHQTIRSNLVVRESCQRIP